MGADCYAVIEHRSREDGVTWHTWAVLDFPRQYHTFDALAGVRCGHPAADGPCPVMVVRPRGLPSDLSPFRPHVTCRCPPEHEPQDLWLEYVKYRASWLSLSELRQALRNVEADGGHAPALFVVIATMTALEAHGAETRFVFGFDSE